ncbi:beta-xylosidase, partial [Sphingomonas sp. BT553]|nr:beta-xylosidase [Sphingomonas sp. BT553]
RKPAWFAYKYLHLLRGREIATGDDQTLAASEGGRTGVLLWNWQQPRQDISNRPFFTRVLPAQQAIPRAIGFAGLKPGRYRLTIRRTGYHANDSHTRYLEMGSPATLSPAQLAELQSLTRDLPETDRSVTIGRDGRYLATVPMRSNDVVLALLEPAVK